MKLIKKRRSIRRFKPDPVPIAEIEKTLEAARWAPSGGNSQPWQFVIVADKEAIDSIKMFSPGLFYTPPAMVVICLHEDRLVGTFHLLDIGAAMQNILLMAETIGLGCTAIFSFNKEATAVLLSLPGKIKPVLLIAMGYPDKRPAPPPRIPLEELIEARIE